MARNSEKRLSGLNRFLEAKETGEYSMTHALRPLLNRPSASADRKDFKAAKAATSELKCIPATPLMLIKTSLIVSLGYSG